MRTYIIIGFLLAVLLGTAGGSAAGPLDEGLPLPAFQLDRPEDKIHRDYLRIPENSGSFSLNDIKAPWILVEIFNMYCTICQGEAPKVNELRDLIRNGPYKDQIVLVGLGMGNSNYEVSIFKNKYNIRFPLFPDPDYDLHDLFGKPRTPHFLLLKNGPGAPPKIILSHQGKFKDVKAFLKLIHQKAGLQ